MTANIGNPGTYAAAARPGWLEGESMELLARLASTKDKLVEVGIWKGRSTLCLCEFARGHIWSVDHFMGTPVNRDNLHVEARDNRELYLMEVGSVLWPYVEKGTLTIVPKPSIEAAELIAGEGPFDVVWLDGCHTTEAVLADIRAWKPLIKPGGLICGHDGSWESVQLALNEAVPGWTLGPGCSWQFPIPE